MKKILVIDGNSIINRAFYGVRPLTTKSGKNTNAIYGMINIIMKQMDAIKPDYAAVAFDLKIPTFRHKMYAEYKAGRHATPPELLEQFPDAKKCLSLLGIHVMELPGYEADDIQGTVARFAHTNEDTESYILSGDRDLLQLIDEKTTVLLATNMETKPMREAEFFEKYGITPNLFVDMKAIMGDSSDNIPGVRGIGEKGAAALIQNFGTLENIYANLDDSRITKGVKAKLEASKDDAFLSRTLAKIETSAPIGISLEDIKYEGPDKEGLYKIFTELELNSFIVKFGLTGAREKNEENAEKTDDVCEKKAPEAKKCDKIKLDTGCHISTGSITAVLQKENGYSYFENGELHYTESIEDIKHILTSCGTIVCYDAKKLIHSTRDAGISPSDETVYLDLLLYEYVLNPGSGNAGIASLCSMFLGDAPTPDDICASHLIKLEPVMREKCRENGVLTVLDELELPLAPILAEIEENGFKIDTDGMQEYSVALEDLARDLQERIYVQALGEFNINSPKQLGEVLYVKLGLPQKKKKNKNGFSTDAETLEELRQYSPIIDDILEYRQVTKLNGTYAAGLPKLADKNSRIHTDFKQALTATGRLSSADPNLQNIPIKTKMGRQMRKYFVAEDGYSLVDADYSQIELRLLAHISDDYNMSEAFKAGVDIHRKTAAAVFGLPEESVNEEMRKRAKAVNFGIVYGISGFSLAKDIGTSVTEATKYIKNYLMNYPSIDVYLESVTETAKENGYTETLLGRRRYIPELNAANGALRAFGKRVAMNAPIQGTAADIMKIAMIKVYRRLKAEEPAARLVMQVHDELIVEAPDERVEAVKRILKEEMENAYKLNVPLTVEVTSGKNWLEQE